MIECKFSPRLEYGNPDQKDQAAENREGGDLIERLAAQVFRGLKDQIPRVCGKIAHVLQPRHIEGESENDEAEVDDPFDDDPFKLEESPSVFPCEQESGKQATERSGGDYILIHQLKADIAPEQGFPRDRSKKAVQQDHGKCSSAP